MVRKGDGTGLGAEGYSQVRKGDGTVLWNAIPDSALDQKAVHRWAIADGEGAELQDNIAEANATFNGGPTWTENSNRIAGWEIDFDGVDDEAVVSSGDANRNPPGDQGALVFSLFVASDASVDSDFAWRHADNGNDNRLYVRVDDNNGNLRLGVGGDAPFPSHTITTGSVTRIGLLWNTGDWTLYENGTEQETGTYSSSIDMSPNDWSFGSGGGTSYLDSLMDNVILCNEEPTATEMSDDYQEQPWT